MYRGLQRVGLMLLILVCVLAVGGYAYLQHPKFGALPDGSRLQAVERSSHYANGEFHNLIDTPMRTKDSSFLSNVLSLIFDRNENLQPRTAIASTKIDLKSLPPDKDVLVWLGHSSYFVLLGGRRIDLAPVSRSSSPSFYAAFLCCAACQRCSYCIGLK